MLGGARFSSLIVSLARKATLPTRQILRAQIRFTSTNNISNSSTAPLTSATVRDVPDQVIIAPTTSSSPTEPIAVVFGGFAFKQNHMKRHALLYESKGFKTVPYFNPTMILTRPMAAKERGKEIAKELLARNQPMVFHVISGSFWTFIYVLDALGPRKNELVKGIVIDSAPPMSDIYAFGGYVAHITKQPALKSFYSQPFRLFRAYQGIHDKWESDISQLMIDVFWKGLPILFLCSRNDPVLSIGYVEKYIEDLKSRDLDVRSKIWEKARHTLGIIDHSEQYHELVEQLLKDSMRKQ
eukprot:TRINITY_DN10725_c0_g1_i1.p1 TRINITY_DN10725_c0_g1~~TRINITY_DN10725_c0_g1_i1.p1  ORF type:complete len:297 (-),score=51.02 TRINITY_DN10725_c0_g1_i1:38-928(-)